MQVRPALPPGDIDALAANLLQLLDDPALRAQFGEYGRLRVERHFTPQRMASDFTEALCAYAGVKQFLPDPYRVMQPPTERVIATNK